MAYTITEFDHLKIPLEKILEATNNFDDKNIIGEGGFGKVYKGKLLRSGELINISARRLDRKHGQGDVEFWTEISALSLLRHDNIVSMIGFCDETDEKIIINHHDVKGSLSMFLSDPTFSWYDRLRTCVGIAKAIEYIHHVEGRAFSFIHRNINSSTILLDDKWQPKLSGFEFSIKQSLDRKNKVIRAEVIGTKGYIDPTYVETGTVSQKSDVYSFGVVLFDILFGKNTYIPNEQENKWFQAPLPIFHNERNTLRNSWEEYGLGRFTKLAYSCLNEEREQRPAINEVISELTRMESIVQDSLRPDLIRWIYKTSGRLEHFAFGCMMVIIICVYTIMYIMLEIGKQILLKFRKEVDKEVEKEVDKEVEYQKVKNIEHLRINLKDIQLATGDFSLDDPVQLECFDRDYIPSVKGKNIAKLPKKLYTVRIQRIETTKAFYSELEFASSCKHHNIQPLLGFCDEGSRMMLVYNYPSYKYSLERCLGPCTLTWEQRLKICIDVAQGLHYLHHEMEDQKMVIHNNISLGSIALDDNWRARIVGFQGSIFLPLKQDEAAFDGEVFYADFRYIDHEYVVSKKLRRESDVYSFGVVMSEILFGKSGLNIPILAQHRGMIKKEICPALKGTYSENNFILHKGPDEDSLDTFVQIICECLAPTHSQRPTMKVVIAKLKRALSLQENYKDTFRILYQDIELATENFSRHNYVGGGGFGGVYKGEIARGNGHQAIVAKRLDTRFGQGEEQYYNELQILCRYKHANVIGLVGYSNETGERIIVYEHASRGSLDRYLNDAGLTWKKRLNICIDVASGLAFLHGDAETGQEVVIHRDIKTPNILLFDDWKAKVGDFGLSLITTLYEGKNYIIDHACGTRGYVDPVYEKTRFLTIESDIYSFGVVLFEILCGRSTYPINKNEGLFLDSVKHSFEEGKQEEMVFEAIKKEILPKSLLTFQMIAYRCLHDDREKRPTAKEVLAQLKMALEYQEENNIHEPDVMDLSEKLEDINLKPAGGSLNQTA